MGGTQTVSAAAQKIVDLVRDFPSGISRRDLAAEATRRFRGLPERRLAKLVAEAVGVGLLIETCGRLTSVAAPETPTGEQPPASDAKPSGGTKPPGGAGSFDDVKPSIGARPSTGTKASDGTSPSGTSVLRAVALDIESVVRTIATSPYVERHVYEAAAVRFGADPEWKKLRATPGLSDAEIVSNINNAILRPAANSMIR